MLSLFQLLLAAIFGLAGLGLEWVAWQMELAPLPGKDGALLWYLSWHALGSASFAFSMLAIFPQSMIRPRRYMFFLFAGWCYSLAVVGFPMVLIAALFMRFYRRPLNRKVFGTLALPEFDPHQRPGTSGFRQAGLKTFLGNEQVPVQSRLTAMVALQNVSSKIAAPMLRDVLADPEDDLRLLAYGMMDGKEKKINKSISEELHILESEHLENGEPVTDEIKLKATRRLSELYWELVYQELAQGDLRDFSLRSSMKYCYAVLEAEPGNAQVHLRLGRLYHVLGELDKAVDAYNKAISCGLPMVRVIPFLAELEFGRKNFANAKQLMSELAAWRSQPRLQPIIDYWTQE